MNDDRCERCNAHLAERSRTSPKVRYCQDCWWETQRLAYAASDPVHPLAVEVLEGWWAR